MDCLSSVFFSNRVERLYIKLKESLFSSSQPFDRRLIIVPSPAMKTWLMFHMAQDLQVAAGIEVGYIDQTLTKLMSLFSSDSGLSLEKKVPSALELALNLEAELKNVLAQAHLLDPKELAIWRPVFDYLKFADKDVKKNLSQKTEKRLIALAEKLAFLFVEYGKYGGSLIKKWKSEPFSNWQQQLWFRLESKFTPWGYPYQQLESFTFNPSRHHGTQVHLFGLSYLSPLHHRFLMKAGKLVKMHYYQLSPCQEFWTDILSNQESQRLKNYWKKKGASSKQQFALDEFLRDTNPLLANFGRLGREMALQLEESQLHSEEEYVLPETIQEKEIYRNLLSEDQLYLPASRELSLLEALQSDLTLLRHPEPASKVILEAFDGSIQVHSVSRRMQEVQILYDTLLKAMEKHAHEDSPIRPGDVIVMSPNIMDYEPYIKSVFGNRESQLDFHLMDLQMPAKSLIIQAFLHLLEIPLGRWNVNSLLQLLNYRCFQDRHHLTLEDVQTIRHWIKESGIVWGKNRQHRNEILKRNYCKKEMIAEGEEGTWEYGFDRLLSGLAMLCDDENDSHLNMPYPPLNACETSQGELLGRFIHLFQSLYSDLKPILEETLTLKEWTEYLKNLLEAYFSVSSSSDQEKDYYKTLLGQIDAFAKSSGTINEETFSFLSIKKHLEALLTKESVSYKETHLHAVKFCSLLPMRSIPAKIICLLGMQEEAFPRKDESLSLNLLREDPEADYYPSPIDFDRYLFLEALLSARQYLIITYIGHAKSLQNSSLPSLLVRELLSYLDQAFLIEGKKPSEMCFFQHPFLSFDKSYFLKNSPISSYSQDLYRAAVAYYQSEKKEAHQFISSFQMSPVDIAAEVCLNMKELTSFARDPVKFYFNRSLGIYLEKDEDRLIKDEEDFQVSHLQKALLAQKSFLGSFTSVISHAKKEGHLPQGPFKKINIEKIEDQFEEYRSNLALLEIKSGQFFDIEFDMNCEKPTQVKSGWKVPALMIPRENGTLVRIVGSLPNVTQKGLIAFAKEEASETIKLWPRMLVFSSLLNSQQLPISNQLVFAKSGKSRSLNFDNSIQRLGKYLDYYFMSAESPSPLIPDWVPQLLCLNSAEFSEKISKLRESKKSPQYYEYLKWLDQGSIQSWQTIAENWQEMAHQLFADLIFDWFPKLKKKEDSDAKL